MKRTSYFRCAAMVLVLVVAFAAIPSSAEGEDIYFTAVNDTLKKLEASTMPYYDKEQYYVPYKIFDDLSLGVYYTYNKENYTLTFFNRNNTLIFQLLLGYSYDNNQQYRESTIDRNGTLYIPIKFVCERFDLEFQLIKTPVPIIRVVSDAELSANEFKDKYHNRTITEGREYLNSGQNPSPSPSIPGPGRPGVSPTPSDEPAIIPEVFLSFDCYLFEGVEDGLIKMLDTLDSRKVKATFFLTEDVIDSERDTVLRIIGTGHSVGILVPKPEVGEGEQADAESLVEEMDSANRLLDSYTYTKTNLCRFQADSLGQDDEGTSTALQEAGYALWGWTMDADSVAETTVWQTYSRWATEIETSAENNESVVFRAELSDDLYESLSLLLDYLDDENAILHIITPAMDSDEIIQ